MIGWASKPTWNDYFFDRELWPLCEIPFEPIIEIPDIIIDPVLPPVTPEEPVIEVEVGGPDMVWNPNTPF